jgi:SAM-dependent methyltransferase
VNVQDEINQQAWRDPGGVRWLEHIEGFVDAGERAAYARLRDEARNRPILDLGVGAGRTVQLLRALSPAYIAIDYTEVLVETARRRFPDVDIRLGDARDLSAFADESFSLVVFSYMGIDAVDHHDRARILSEVRRVLEPNGVFWFSTLNLSGSALRRRPWWPELPSAGDSKVRGAVAVGKTLARVPRDTLNYFRVGRQSQHGPGWRIAPFFAYHYGLLCHYTTYDSQMAELLQAGFAADPLVIDDVHGEVVSPGGALSDVFSFHVLARKPL